jgi:hypothetical protein
MSRYVASKFHFLWALKTLADVRKLIEHMPKDFRDQSARCRPGGCGGARRVPP